MVKADPQRNYYADLDVASTADDNTIRKAFRKLALIYHPDRNPGREAEVLNQFQAIQAAHEILSDPIQRLKYDNDRKRYRNANIPVYSSPRTRPPPTSRNATTNPNPSASYYTRTAPPKPPPPKPERTERPPPPQHHNTYSNGADRFKNFKPPPTAQRPSRSGAEDPANVFTAWQKMKQPRGAEPQANNAREPFGRSKSTRVPSKNGFDPNAPGTTHEPAAPRSSYRSSHQRWAPPAPSPPRSTETPKPARNRDDSDDVPFTEGMSRIRTPYASTKGERMNMFGEGVGRSSSVRNSPTSRSDPFVRGGFASDSGKPPPPKGFNGFGGNATKPFASYDSSSEESEVEEIPPTSWKPRASPKTPHVEEIPKDAWKPRTSPRTSSNQKKPTPRPATTNFGFGPDTATPNVFKSRSAESINMKFSPNEWKGKFEGTPDYFAPNPSKGTTAKGRVSPTRGRSSHRSATNQLPSRPPPPPPFPPPPPVSQMPPPPPLNTKPNLSPSASAPHSAKFTPEEWQQSFKESSWALPVQETSPRRGPVPVRRSKASNRKPSTVPNGAPIIDLTGGTPASGSRASSPDKPKYQAFAEDAGSEASDAMDIDSDPVMPMPRAPPPKAKVKTAAPGSSSLHRTVPSIGSEGGVPLPSAPTDSAPENGPATKFDSLTGLNNIEPLSPSTNGAGIGALGDIGSSLPFKSRAATTHPTKPTAPQELPMPLLPIAPEPPVEHNSNSYAKYLADMNFYFKAFRKFNQKMIEHFDARERQFELSLDPDFLTNSGEKTNTLGFDSYMNILEEDDRAREHWRVGNEKHRAVMQKCKEMRQRAQRAFAVGEV